MVSVEKPAEQGRRVVQEHAVSAVPPDQRVHKDQQANPAIEELLVNKGNKANRVCVARTVHRDRQDPQAPPV